MRADEEFAKQAFDQYLENKGVSERIWRDGDEPPDYYLTTDNEDFVVEVTTLIIQVQTSPQPLSSATVHGSVIKFVKEIEKTALNAGTLRGKYFIFFTSRPDFYALRDQLKKQILTFVGNTFLDDEYPSSEIKLNKRTYCSIMKTSIKENTLRWGAGPSHTMRLETANKFVCHQMQDSIIKKYGKLVHLEHPKILILRNDYPWEECQIRQEHFVHLDHLSDFHTVFVIGRNNYVFHSINSDWI